MKVNGLVVSAVVAVAAVVAIALSRKTEPPVDQATRAAVEPAPPTFDMPDATTGAPDVRPGVKSPHVIDESSGNLPETGDYYAFLIDTLPAAEAGDVNAQFNVWKAMSYCDESIRFYFVRGGRKLTLEEGLGWAIKRNLPYATAQRAYDRCRGFIEAGSAIDTAAATRWLNAAAEHGHSVAQSVLAEKILEEDMLRELEGASGTQNLGAHLGNLDRTKTPAELMQAAVKSRDPEVLFRIGEMMPLLKPAAPDVSLQRLAWMAVACERGLDCSAQADWVAASCLTAECASINNNTEVVRIIAGDRWSAVQQRARQLGESLDAGRWEDLGIGSAGGQG